MGMKRTAALLVAGLVPLAGCERGPLAPEPDVLPPIYAVAGSAPWQALDLGALGGTLSMATGINGVGQVVGYTRRADGSLRPFLWANRTMTDLGLLPDMTSCRAEAINDVGQITGYCTAGSAAHTPFLWEEGTMRALSLPEGLTSFTPHAINDAGQIVGISTAAGSSIAYVWDAAQMTEVVPPSGSVGAKLDINNFGHVAATYYGDFVRGFVWKAGQITEIAPAEGESGSVALGLNDAGQVTGYTITASGGHTGYLWQNGQMTRMQSPTWVTYTIPYDVNESGQVVGQLYTWPESRIFYWESGTMTELPGLSGTWGWPGDINDAGQVVGMSEIDTAERHATLWAQGAGLAPVQPGNPPRAGGPFRTR